MAQIKMALKNSGVTRSREVANRMTRWTGRYSTSPKRIQYTRPGAGSPPHDLVTSEATKPCAISTLSFKCDPTITRPEQFWRTATIYREVAKMLHTRITHDLVPSSI